MSAKFFKKEYWGGYTDYFWCDENDAPRIVGDAHDLQLMEQIDGYKVKTIKNAGRIYIKKGKGSPLIVNDGYRMDKDGNIWYCPLDDNIRYAKRRKNKLL